MFIHSKKGYAMASIKPRPRPPKNLWFCRCQTCRKAYLIPRPAGTLVEQYLGLARCPDIGCKGLLLRTKQGKHGETPTEITREQAGL
jgi:hypothetical protein